MDRAARRRADRAARKGTTLDVDPLAITWYSNAIWAPTGYGTQSAQAVHRLADDGHKVAVASNYGLAAMRTTYEGIPHYPSGVETYSSDVVEPTFHDWSRANPGLKPLLIALFDAWPLKGPSWDRMPVAIWTMVDHLPVPPAVLKFLGKPNVQPLAASRFAHEQIQAAGVDSIYVPMAIDPNVYKPTTAWHNGTQPMTGRELMGFDDDVFVVSCINANKSGNSVHRKAWAENVMAFGIFAQRHDDVRLYLHTERHGNFGGVDFEPLMKSLSIPEHKYRFVNQWGLHTGIPNEAMAALYTASDVMLASTYGEGFGLTVLEAGACQTPAIVSDFTCQPELVSGDSFIVGGQAWWDSYQAAWWQVPNVGEIVEALEAAYQRGRFRSTAQREHALTYDADVVYRDFWRPALARIVNEPEPAIVPLPGERVGPAAPTNWSVNDDNRDPLLTIYIPAYKRPVELRALLDSVASQVDERVEVILSDDDPAGSALEPTRQAFSRTTARVLYERRRTNVGGDVNLLRAYRAGSAPWVWMIGDDDALLPGAVDAVLEAIARDDVDRLILLTEFAPRNAAGVTGSMPEIAELEPALPIAATLVTANVVRRSETDFVKGFDHTESMYGHSWALTGITRVHVVEHPCFIVGTEHVNGYVNAKLATSDVIDIWGDLLRGYGITPSNESYKWNFVSAANRAKADAA